MSHNVATAFNIIPHWTLPSPPGGAFIPLYPPLSPFQNVHSRATDVIPNACALAVIGHNLTGLKLLQFSDQNRGSSVDIATGCDLDDRETGFRVPVASIMVISPYRPTWCSGAHLTDYRMCTGSHFSGAKAARA
jgi:hypothetical protein